MKKYSSIKSFIIVIFSLSLVCCSKESPTSIENVQKEPKNRPPEFPSNPSPNLGEKVPSNMKLMWECWDPDLEKPEQDTLRFDVYLGTTSPPSLIDSNQTLPFYDPGQLLETKKYYWKVVAKDNDNNYTEGPIWSFSTLKHLDFIGTCVQGRIYDIFIQGNYMYLDNYEPSSEITSSFQIFNIADPLNPHMIGTFPTGCTAGNIFIKGNYAYLPMGSSGVDIIEISSHEDPVLINTIKIPSGYVALKIFLDQDYAYLLISKYGYKKLPSRFNLLIFNLSEPSNPELVSNTIIEAKIFSPTDIFLSNQHLFVLAKQHLRIFDVANPSKPSLLSVIEFTVDAFSLYVEANYAFIANGSEGLKVIDVTDASNPLLIGTYETEWARGVYVEDNYACLFAGSSLDIFDVTIPSDPLLVGKYEIGSIHGAGRKIGLWKKENFIYLGANEQGLLIFKFKF